MEDGDEVVETEAALEEGKRRRKWWQAEADEELAPATWIWRGRVGAVEEEAEEATAMGRRRRWVSGGDGFCALFFLFRILLPAP